MDVIYQPKGRALEYSPLALNLYTGCTHKCGYCYAPGVMFKSRDKFHSEVEERTNILERLEADCKKMSGDPRDILLCFSCDPYQPEAGITRAALRILATYNMRVQILTKGGLRAVEDFDILKKNNWKFGATILFSDPQFKAQWEPYSAGIGERLASLCIAHDEGITTWLSVEPVIDPTQALRIIKWTAVGKYVDFWRIGKINYHKYIEEKIDWKKFLEDVEELLFGKVYYIKKDLWVAAGRDPDGYEIVYF